MNTNTTSKSKVCIEVGPLCPKLAQQLAALNLPEKKIDQLQQRADAINTAYVYGDISESEWRNACKRFLKSFGAYLVETQKEAA